MEELKLALSPQLHQMMELLGASRREVAALVEAELARNPALRLVGIMGQAGEGADLQVTFDDEGGFELVFRPFPPLWMVEQPSPTAACREQADFFRTALAQREEVLVRVARALVVRQAVYLRGHIAAPIFVALGRLADEVGLHPTTLGRVLANKTLASPQGILELTALLGRPLD